MSAVAVLRDTSDGDCFLVSVGRCGLDEARLEESRLELAGWLRHPEQHNGGAEFADTEDEADETGLTQYRGLYFTECSDGLCDRMIAIIDECAPDFCSIHEREAGL